MQPRWRGVDVSLGALVCAGILAFAPKADARPPAADSSHAGCSLAPLLEPWSNTGAHCPELMIPEDWRLGSSLVELLEFDGREAGSELVVPPGWHVADADDEWRHFHVVAIPSAGAELVVPPGW